MLRMYVCMFCPLTQSTKACKWMLHPLCTWHCDVSLKVKKCHLAGSSCWCWFDVACWTHGWGDHPYFLSRNFKLRGYLNINILQLLLLYLHELPEYQYYVCESLTKLTTGCKKRRQEFQFCLQSLGELDAKINMLQIPSLTHTFLSVRSPTSERRPSVSVVTVRSPYSLRRRTHIPVKTPSSVKRGHSRVLVSLGRHKLRRLSPSSFSTSPWSSRTGMFMNIHGRTHISSRGWHPLWMEHEAFCAWLRP